MPHDARAVANRVLDIGDGLDLALTHMAVHKIIYFAHGFSLAATSVALVNQQFEAWEHGPVLRVVWNSLRGNSKNVIKNRIEIVNPINGSSRIANEKICEDQDEILINSVKYYGKFHAVQLSIMTHQSGDAWDRVWNSRKLNFGMKIRNEDIRLDFLRSPTNLWTSC